MCSKEVLKGVFECVSLIHEGLIGSFGPHGNDQLIAREKDGKLSVLVCNSGSSILELLQNHKSLRRVHGIYIIKLLKSFDNRWGDGITRLVIILHKALEQLLPFIDNQSHGAQICRDLETIRSRLFGQDDFLRKYLLERVAVPVDLKKSGNNEKAETEKFKQASCKLIASSLRGQFSPNVEKFLLRCLKIWIETNIADCDNNFAMMQRMLQTFVSRIDSKIVFLTKSRLDFQVLPTNCMLIDRPFLHRARHQHSRRSFSNANHGVVVLDIPLFEAPNNDIFKVHVETAEGLASSLKFREIRIAEQVKTILDAIKKFCKDADFGLLMSTYELPDPGLSILESFNAFGVQCVDSDMARELCTLAGVEPVADLDDLISNSHRYVFSAKIQEVQIDEQSYAIKLDNIPIDTHMVPSQIVIQSPSLGIAKQCKDAIRRGMQMIFQWTTPPELAYVKGGCSFEFALLAALLEQREAFGVHQKSSLAHSILYESILAVPSAVLCRSKSSDWRRLCLKKLSSESIASHSGSEACLGLDIARSVYASHCSDCNAVQPLSLGVDYFSVVLDILIQLLRIDKIVHVRKG